MKTGSSQERVANALETAGLDCPILEMPATTRTAEDAAAAVGCDVGQIVKSLIFQADDPQRAVLVLTSGSNRVDTDKIRRQTGLEIGRADAEFVRRETGFAIGGVSPVGHLNPVSVYIDRDLLAYETVWAAAGTPNSVFEIGSGDLVALTGGTVIDVSESQD